MDVTVETAKFKVEARQLNESLYELHLPQDRLPSMQVLFFHGFQQKYEDAHLFTWTSGDESGLWPQTWLVDKFPDAHILSVSYYEGKLKDILKNYQDKVDLDMTLVVENLISDLLQAKIGQEPRCPVVLIGHSFGGLVVKQLIVNAINQLGDTRAGVEESTTIQLLKLVDNLKGVFFYATPHHGIENKSIKLLDPALLIPTGPLLEYVTSLNKMTARLNSDFDRHRKQQKWRIAGLGESLPSKWGRWSEGLIVPEGSSRYSENFTIALGEDHISISRPKSKISRSFTAVESLLKELGDDPQLFGLPGNWQDVPESIVGIEEVVKDVKEKLETTTKIGFVGMGGVGKTTLAMALFNFLERGYQYTCFIRDVKNLQGPRYTRVKDAMLESLHYGGKLTTDKDSQFGFLRKKRLLLVLDDVSTEADLKIVSTLQRVVDRNSRFIATSRDRALIELSSHEVYDVKLLGKKISSELFNKYAFPNGFCANREFKDIVDEVVEKSEGLPLTLEVMGKHLRGKEELIWQEALYALDSANKGAGLEENLWSILKLSYDGLVSVEEKAMFLDASTVFYKVDLSIAMAAWNVTAEGVCKTSWQRLVELSLVREISEGKKVKVGMHEQLLSLGKMIASTLREDGYTCRIWNDNEKALRLLSTNNQDTDGLKDIIALKCCKGKLNRLNISSLQGMTSRFEARVTISGTKLQKMTKLKYLWLEGVDIDQTHGSKLASGLSWFHSFFLSHFLLEDIQLPSTLVYLHLSGVNFSGFTFNPHELSRIAILKIVGCGGLRKLPETFVLLQGLEHIELLNTSLRSIPDFAKLTALKTLTLSWVSKAKLPSLPECLQEEVKWDFPRPSALKVEDGKFVRDYKLTGSVYEFYSPPDGVSLSLEIIFFHGLERGDYSKSYVETWTSFSEATASKNCWPQTLLAKEFQRARILSVSYNSNMSNLNLHETAEYLGQVLIDDAKVAANSGIPVILIGKDFGGLVIKAICMEARAQNRLTFLSNLKGIFYYGTPHLGIENLPTAFDGASMGDTNNEIGRLGSTFRDYRKNKWATRAIVSLRRSEKLPDLVISDASQRYDVDEYYAPSEDIDTVCKSQTQTSSSFKFLTGFISLIERKLLFESSPAQGSEESVGLKTSLDFGNDRSYVPMKRTLGLVKRALQQAHVVILHGGPGSGKSSLARYLALQFEAAAQSQDVAATCSTEQSWWLPDGVVYMTCGSGADIVDLQRELLGKLDIEVPFFQDKWMALKGAAESQRMLRRVLVEHLSKLQSPVLVVLDDCKDSHLVENLLVPVGRVRYLLTTQISTLCNAHDSKRVQIQDVSLKDARHILGNYANCEGGVISKDLQNLADEVIAATRFHPLALATLGVVLDNKERTLKAWNELKNSLKEHLRSNPLSVDASMTVVLNLLDEDAKALLYKICLFDGPFIPETLLRLFLMYTPQRDKKINISRSKMDLVAKGLVRIKTETVGEGVTHPIHSSVGGHTRVLWIHSLHQHFILTTKTEEIRQITAFLNDDRNHKFGKSLRLGERCNLDLATALCALYGATDIKKRALRKMGSHFIWSKEQSCRLASALKPLVFLMSSEGDTKSLISQAAAEVFIKCVCKREHAHDKISYLLKSSTYPSAPLATLRALADIFSIKELKLIDEDHLHFGKGYLSLLVDIIRATLQARHAIHSNQLAAYAASILVNLSYDHSEAAISKIFHTEGLLICLVQSLSAHDNHLLQECAATALANLAGGDVERGLKICNTEGAISGLVRALSAHDNYPLQNNAARALTNLARGDLGTGLKICNTEGAISGLVRALSAQDNHTLQENAAMALTKLSRANVERGLKISNTEGALSGLVRALSAHDNHPLQEYAAKALTNLAWAGVEIGLKICNTQGAISDLVWALSAQDNHPLQEYAAKALTNLAMGDVETGLKICTTEGALSGLVRALSAHYNHPLQEYAAKALTNLAWAGVEIGLQICNTQGAISDLVRALSAQDNHPLQEYAAKALTNLAMGDVETGLKICTTEGALSGLVRALSAHYNQPLQEFAARALTNLAAGDLETGLKICTAEGALSGLVLALSAHDNHPLQKYAAWVLTNVAEIDDKTRVKICNTKGALSGLVRALSAHNNQPLQEYAARALSELASADVEIGLKICNTEEAISGLVLAMSAHDNHPLQEYAARALSDLAGVDVEIGLKICKTEGTILGLVGALCAHDNHPLREYAAMALTNLACVDVETGLKICNTDGAISGLVRALSADDNHPLQENAAVALTNLAGDVETGLKLCNTDGVISGLVLALSADYNHRLQENAAVALTNLAADVETGLKVFNTEGALSGLVLALSAHDNHPLQEYAAGALSNLAWVDVEIGLKICNTEGAISGLVWALSAHGNHRLQKNAAAAWTHLARGDVETRRKICNAEGVLSALTRALSAQDNHPLQEYASRALSNLAWADVEIGLKICNTEGAISGLVGALSAHDNQLLQESAAGALTNLARGNVETRLKICNTEGAISGLVQVFSALDNPPAQEDAAQVWTNLAGVDFQTRLKICRAEAAM